MILLAKNNLLNPGKDRQKKSVNLEKYELNLKKAFANMGMPADWIAEQLLMTLETKLQRLPKQLPVDDQSVHELIVSMLNAIGHHVVAAEYGRINKIKPEAFLTQNMRTWNEAEIEALLLRKMPLEREPAERLAWYCQTRLQQLGIVEATEDFIIQLAIHLHSHDFGVGLVDPVTGALHDLQPPEFPKVPPAVELPPPAAIYGTAPEPVHSSPAHWLFIPMPFWQEHADDFTQSLLKARVLQPEPVLRTYPRLGLHVALTAMDKQFLDGWASPLSCLQTMQKIATSILLVLSKMQLAYAEVLDKTRPNDCRLVFAQFNHTITKSLGPMKKREKEQMVKNIRDMLQKMLSENAALPVNVSFQ